MIRTSLFLLLALFSTNSFAASRFVQEERLALQLVRESILDEADQMHTQVKAGATKFEKIEDELGGVEIGYAVEVTVEGYTFEKGNYEETLRFEYLRGSLSKIVRK